MTTSYVVADGVKRIPTADEWEMLLGNKIPELIRRYKDGALDPTAVNDTVQWVLDGMVITKEKKVVMTPPKPKPEKFGLLADLGIITVPSDYVHRTHFAKFWRKHQGGEKKSFYGYDANITDVNFNNPTRILKPGDKLWVRAFQQGVSGTTTTSVERMDFLRRQPGNQFVGAQGASQVFEQKKGQLPKGKGYASFDEVDLLWEDSRGHRRVPSLRARTDGAFDFVLGYFEIVWYVHSTFLCFCDLPAGEATLVA